MPRRRSVTFFIQDASQKENHKLTSRRGEIDVVIASWVCACVPVLHMMDRSGGTVERVGGRRRVPHVADAAQADKVAWPRRQQRQMPSGLCEEKSV